MSFIDDMRRYGSGGATKLHTPGHKGRLTELDITELTDGSFPDAQISEAQNYIAGVYGAKHCSLLCGGSSQGVKAAIYFANGVGIVDKNSHRSVFDGFRLAGKKCITVGGSDVRPITLDDIKKAYTRGVKLVVVTSPTYYGYTADIAAISEFCRSHGLLLVVDGAHGAHFGFSERLPDSFSHIPDICNMSVHKTLFALTQSAILLDNLDGPSHAALSEDVKLMGTTSPSYLLYSSIESAVHTAADGSAATAYEELYNALVPVRSKYPFLKNDDFTRLVLDCNVLDVQPEKFNGALARQGVMSELVTDRYIVFIFTAADSVQSVNALDNALAAAIEGYGR